MRIIILLVIKSTLLLFSSDTPLSRDFVYIDDVIDSIMLALKYKLDNKMKHKIFNIATGISTPLPDIAKLLQNEMRKSSLKQVRRIVLSYRMFNTCSGVMIYSSDLMIVCIILMFIG